ncbi:hypothetical protein TPHA_0D02220 [Tetrapisispora phaffii CBS 4417]|uniref:Uncharacterized protein n=1 Tax=Tetrapisispora phaffii (strain ATCC 24235 / CBS 4417 / NBRC 1672 / NRRL Y-8282 / UCD 70-5) TaxID=1071381 RepID=G8BSN9_TETPH|nr:hypothetical protein TPHA_0D02220 [Tetrapisispora phaffii CBS 4417]CCE62860.1 hypothetical protein TPHA_0D02220 [Tetrapisispora phaffii CBS 4417]
MANIFQIPTPLKYIFNGFPLKTYGPISNTDKSMVKEIESRRYYFRGTNSIKTTLDDTFLLGVYNVFEDEQTNSILATDPICLFVEIVLCQQNSLKLPQANVNRDTERDAYTCSLACLSPLSNKGEELPILAEGFKKRFIRSSFLINESIKIKMQHNQSNTEMLYVELLDSSIYDGWISHVLFTLDKTGFSKLYLFDTNQSVFSVKESLIKSNGFSLRHRRLSEYLSKKVTIHTKTEDIQKELIQPIVSNCEETLLKFEEIIKKEPTLWSNNKYDTIINYLNIKIISYVKCLLNLPDTSSLRLFLVERCPNLIKYAEDSIIKYIDEQ